MGNTCTCEKSKETNLQELIDKEKLIQEEMKRKEAEEKMGFLPSSLADEETSLDDIKNQCK